MAESIEQMQTRVTRFLIVENDAIIRGQLERLVLDGDLGQSVSVGSIREAIQALDHEPVHIVISAWNLPGLATGLALLRMVRGEDRFRHLGFVLLSEPSSDEGSKVRSARAAHVDGYLLKPVDEPALTSLLREVSLKVPDYSD